MRLMSWFHLAYDLRAALSNPDIGSAELLASGTGYKFICIKKASWS